MGRSQPDSGLCGSDPTGVGANNGAARSLTSKEGSLSRFLPWPPTGRTLVAVDGALLIWTLVWVLLGISVAQEVRGLSELSGTIRTVGGAVEESGVALQGLDDIPVVGGGLAEPAQRIQEAGRSVEESGASSRESIDDLSTLLGLSVALIPSIPILAFYLPLRLARRAEARSLERVRARAVDERRFNDFLAQRALNHLPYRTLAELGADPSQGLHAADSERLAAAELKRLGLSVGAAEHGRGS